MIINKIDPAKMAFQCFADLLSDERAISKDIRTMIDKLLSEPSLDQKRFVYQTTIRQQPLRIVRLGSSLIKGKVMNLATGHIPQHFQELRTSER